DVGVAEQLVPLPLCVLDDDAHEFAFERGAHATQAVRVALRDAHHEAIRREDTVAIDDHRTDVELPLEPGCNLYGLHARSECASESTIDGTLDATLNTVEYAHGFALLPAPCYPPRL